jgi:eukaryotic-like serine/threonine-protein kinase
MIGKLFDNRYEILEQADKGGTSFVYRAVDRKTKNIVAVKVLKQELSKKKDFIKRFENEVAAALSLDHSNIVHVIDAGHTDDRYYLVMEFIEGKTLKQIINEEGALDLKRAVEISICVCNALNHAHSAGFVHRDIKPQNIMINKEGQVKITDFGIARNLFAIERVDKNNTKIMGSVQYIPPEQAKGEKTDRRADIYSLGISLFEMITGTLPFEGDTSVEVALKHLKEPIPHPKRRNDRINDALNKIVLKATRKNKKIRYSSAVEFAEDLKQCFEYPAGEYVKLEREHVKLSPKDRIKIRKRIVLSISLILASAVVVAVTLISLAMFGTKSNTEFEAPDPIKAPLFIGLTEIESTELANETGVKLERVYAFSKEIPEGEVISQNPNSGDMIQPNSEISIIFSQGIEMVSMPDVLNQDLEDVRDLLAAQNILVGDVEYIESEIPEGYVVSQDPEPDAMFPIDEDVNLVVSKIIDFSMAVVPDMTGISVDEVKGLFEELEFNKCFVYLEGMEENGEERELEPGFVLAQSPQGDTEESIDNPIFIWVGAYESNFHIIKDFELNIPQPDTLVRVTIKEEDSPIEYVMLESKMDKGKHDLFVELFSFEAKEKYMCVYVNDKLVRNTVLTSWRRKEK